MSRPGWWCGKQRGRQKGNRELLRTAARFCSSFFVQKHFVYRKIYCLIVQYPQKYNLTFNNPSKIEIDCRKAVDGGAKTSVKYSV
jgi:hypothetical protein